MKKSILGFPCTLCLTVCLSKIYSFLENDFKTDRLELSISVCSIVGYVFGYRCVSDCRSRGCKFNPDPVTISTVILVPSAESFKEFCCHYRRSMCIKYWLITMFKLTKEMRR